MSKYILKMKGSGPVRTLTMHGIIIQKDRYFGGADFEDIWFSSKDDAYVFNNKKDAQQAATMYGCEPVRSFEIVEI